MTRTGRPPSTTTGRRLCRAAGLAYPYAVNLVLAAVVLLAYVGWRYLGHLDLLHVR